MGSLSTLSWTAPWLLSAFVLLPAIWFLLRAAPPAPRRAPFPALFLLKGLSETKQTLQRTPLWLLILRLVITALIIIALAGPILNAPPPNEERGPLVLIVDNTYVAAPDWRGRQDAMRRAIASISQQDRPIYLTPTAPGLSPDAPIGPFTTEQARKALTRIMPEPFAADRMSALSRLPPSQDATDPSQISIADAEIRWLSDGAHSADAQQFSDVLSKLGALTVYKAETSAPILLKPVGAPQVTQQDANALIFEAERLQAEAPWRGQIVAAARDGRELGRALLDFPIGVSKTNANLRLPLALRNDLASVRIEGVASAAATRLIDARERRALIGFRKADTAGADNLLNGAYYVRKALTPYASFVSDSIVNLVQSDATVIVLDDAGRLRDDEVRTLKKWIEAGGVLLRFAGPTLAEAAQSDADELQTKSSRAEQFSALLPAPLRGGGRAFGGALSWDAPQPIGDFNPNGPFADLPVPTDVSVQRQVLAEPSGATANATWASLADGTPIVTGARLGAGAIVLFHVTATPTWSDLPISGVFIDMLRRLTALSAIAPQEVNAPSSEKQKAEQRFVALRRLTGQGRLVAPRPNATPITLREAAQGPEPTRLPGLYGAPDAPIAVNAVNEQTTLKPLALERVTIAPYDKAAPQVLGAPLLAIALLLLAFDQLAALLLSGRLGRHATTLSLIVLAICINPISYTDAAAQNAAPLDPPITDKTIAAALNTRLAYVITGAPEIDQMSKSGLKALSKELFRRTAIEPAPPVGVDLEVDDLSVYPFLYWPIEAGAEAPSDAALSNLENFMRFGGLIVFDTRDDERAVSGLETPERQALREILLRLGAPPLIQMPQDHVLTRSFYLLEDLPGRMQNTPLWIQTAGARNDAVTPLIIGGRDWAGAWAADEFGRPLSPLSGGGLRAREMTYRAGVNIVMVALTGNYKADQVHTPILLKRLGR